MPVIIVYGVPAEKDQKFLEEFCYSLLNQASSSFGLDLKPKDLSCFFPKDSMEKGLGEEIIIFVEGLLVFHKSKAVCRQYRKELAEALGTCAKEYFPEAKIVCSIRKFNPEQDVCTEF